jgi:hypothetical protein
MKLKIYYSAVSIIILCLCIVLTSFRYDQTKTPGDTTEMLNSILKSISTIKTLRYDLKRTERVKDKLEYTESKVKLQLSPRKLYIAIKGQEVLWTQGTNNGNALVNPGAFPYINLNLDPMGSLMRKNQHHTIHELGMEYLAEILKYGMKRFGDQINKHFVFMGEEKYMGRNCYKLTVAFPDFALEPYTAIKGETIITIANKLHVSEYMILERNPKLSWFTDNIAGQTIQVPNAYGKLFLVMIDKEYMLPISQKIFDDKGLFEVYEFYNLQVNSPIAPEEFTENYKDYHF